MKITHCIILAFLVVGCRETQHDEAAVKQVVLDFVDDFNDGTFRRAETYATIDWQHINPLGGIDDNKETTLKGVRAAHQSFLKNVSMTTDSMKLRFIKPDVALVVAYHTMDDYVTPDSVKHVNQKQIKTYVVVKDDGKWMLTLDHNTVVQ